MGCARLPRSRCRRPCVFPGCGSQGAMGCIEGKPAGPWRAALSAPPSPSPSHPSGLCQPGVRGGVGASPKICGEPLGAPGNGCVSTPKGNALRKGAISPLVPWHFCSFNGAERNSPQEKGDFLQALYTLMLGGGEGLSHRHSSPDAGAHRSQWYLAMPAAELWVILATR